MKALEIKAPKREEIEPGLLPLFRLFVGIQIVLHLVLFLVNTHHPGAVPHSGRPIVVITVASAILLGYLSWPALRTRLSGAYLPIALLGAFLIPVIAQLLAFYSEPGTATLLFDEHNWPYVVELFFPLLIISWQYGFKRVLLFSLGSVLVFLAIGFWAISPGLLRFSNYQEITVISGLSFLAIGAILSNLVGAQRAQRQSLHEANAKLSHYATTLEQLTISRERNRLARELHDTLAHTLSSVAVQLEATRTVWESDPQEARALLERSLATTRGGLTETRRALQELRATPLEDLGLALALRGLAETMAERENLALDLKIDNDRHDLSPTMEQGVYRIAQEALENVAKHARAKRVEVSLSMSHEKLVMQIADDGQGFDPHDIDDGHFGLHGMQERAELLGGSLRIESQRGTGTTVRLEVGL